MKCYSLILGARNTRSRNNRFLPADEISIRKITAHYFPEGFSILNVKGGWFDPSRKVFVKEDARQILICTRHRGTVRRWAQEVATALEQEELLIVVSGRAYRFKPSKSKDTASAKNRGASKIETWISLVPAQMSAGLHL